MAPLILSIEGNIGVGKSTLLKNLRANRELASNGVIFVDEPVAIWERAGLLAAMYKGELGHAAFQLTALTTRYSALVAALRTPGVKLVIAERSLASDRSVFAGTHLGELDARAYGVAYDALVQALGNVRYATVLLKAPIENLQSRVRSRGRDGENMDADDGAGGGGVDAQYLQTIEDAHDKYFDAIGPDQAKVRINARSTAEQVASTVIATIRDLLSSDEHVSVNHKSQFKTIPSFDSPVSMSPTSPTSVLGM